MFPIFQAIFLVLSASLLPSVVESSKCFVATTHPQRWREATGFCCFQVIRRSRKGKIPIPILTTVMRSCSLDMILRG